jgi:hypothetical protein
MLPFADNIANIAFAVAAPFPVLAFARVHFKCRFCKYRSRPELRQDALS